TLPESICWLYNMRGRDVPNTPFVLGFSIVPQTGTPKLYLDAGKVTDEIKQALAGIADIEPVTGFSAALTAFGADAKPVLIDPQTAPAAVAETLTNEGAKLIEKRDPILGPKSRKNDVELAGMREA